MTRAVEGLTGLKTLNVSQVSARTAREASTAAWSGHELTLQREMATTMCCVLNNASTSLTILSTAKQHSNGTA